MFKRKPLPHCEGLSGAQQRMVRKVLAAPFYHVDDYPKIIAAKGWTDVFIALAQQDAMKLDKLSGHFFFSAMIEAQGVYDNALVLPYLREKEGDITASLLLRVMRKLEHENSIVSLLDDMTRDNVKAQALYKVVADKDDKARGLAQLLVAAGADIHYDRGVIIKHALLAQNFDIADDLVKAGFDVPPHAEYIRAYLLQNNADPLALAYLDKLAGRAVVLESAPPPPAVQPEPACEAVAEATAYQRSGDTVSRSDSLPDGGSLTTVFNFATRQQIIIAHVAGQTAAPVITPFSQIEGRAGLRGAAAAFVAQGGVADSVDVILAEATALPLLSGPAKPVVKALSDSR